MSIKTEKIELNPEITIKSEDDEGELESIIKIEPEVFPEAVVIIEPLEIDKFVKKTKKDEPWFVMKPYDIFKQPITCGSDGNVVRKKPIVSKVQKNVPKTGPKKFALKNSRKPPKAARKKPILSKSRSSSRITLDRLSILNNNEEHPQPYLEKSVTVNHNDKLTKTSSKKLVSRPKRSTVTKPPGKELVVQPVSEPWKCDLCPEAFQVRSSLQRHVEFKHNKSETHQCPICDYKSTMRSCFVNHLTIHDEKQECPVCYKFVSFLARHIRIHKKSVKCPTCGMRLSGKGALKAHIKRLHQRIEEFKCDKCPEAFDSKAALRVHTLKNHYEGEMYECHCGALFTGRTCYYRHRATHRNSFKCKVCKRDFLRKDGLLGHWKFKHLNAYGPLKFVKESIANNFTGKFECDMCGRILPNRHCTLVHMAKFHKQPKLMCCDLCPKTFVLKSQMQEHVLLHLKYTRHSCEFCEFVGYSRRSIRQHRMIHLKVECPICNKRVTKLRGHINAIHLQDPRIKCKFCKKKILKGGMEKHIERKHSGKHECMQCAKKFDDRFLLRTHTLKKHYDGKLFECHCGAVYTTNCALVYHQEKHDGKVYSCEICDQKCTLEVSFRAHWRKKHKTTHGPFDEWEDKKSQRPALISKK